MFYMKFAGRVLALFAAVCIFCTASGCLDASTTPSEGGGITAVDLPEPEGLTLAEALAELDLLGVEGGLNVTGASLHQVIGNRVDLEGRASSWTLGLLDAEGVRWLTLGAAGWQEVSLPAPIPEEELNMTELLSPEEIFAMHEDGIRAAMDRLNTSTVDIVLAEGVYTVTTRSDAGMETLAFRADTGEVVV